MQQLTTLYISGLSNSFTADHVFGQPSSVASPRLVIVLLPLPPDSTEERQAKYYCRAQCAFGLGAVEGTPRPQRGRVEGSGSDGNPKSPCSSDNMDIRTADGKGTLKWASAENGVDEVELGLAVCIVPRVTKKDRRQWTPMIITDLRGTQRGGLWGRD